MITIHFEGYWQCRQATDPDPSDDPRGASGYTYAVGDESDLDLIIRLQYDEILEKDFRLRPLPHYPASLLETLTGYTHTTHLTQYIENPRDIPEQEKRLFGIYVTNVTRNGIPYEEGINVLKGGKVRWLPAGKQIEVNGFCPGPRYELRNEITYHTRNGIIMPIVPFDIEITSRDDQTVIRRFDPLDPANPMAEVWQLGMAGYDRRSPQNFFDCDSEIMEALGFDANGDADVQFDAYFQKRKEWLALELSMTHDPVAQEALKNRLFALEFFTENRRLESKLGLKAVWSFELNGDGEVTGDSSFGNVTLDHPWPITFWMGGFDGDVMRGYMRGSLTLPLKN